MDNKRLYSLGIDVKDLKQERSTLKNLIYAPLERPWYTSGIILGGIAIVLMILFGFKGKLSCCTHVSYSDSKSTRSKAPRNKGRTRKTIDNLENTKHTTTGTELKGIDSDLREIKIEQLQPQNEEPAEMNRTTLNEGLNDTQENKNKKKNNDKITSNSRRSRRGRTYNGIQVY